MTSARTRAARTADRLVVGLVRGVRGLKGIVRVEVLTDRSQRFEPGSVLFLEGDDQPLTVAWSSHEGPGVQLRFAEVRDRTGAERLRDRYLEAEASDVALDDGRFWWHELEGVPVTTTDGHRLGAVVDLFRSGGGEVLVVQGDRGEVLVPLVSAVVVELSPRNGRIVVDTDALGLEPERARRPRGRRSSRGTCAAPTTPARDADTNATPPPSSGQAPDPA